MKAVTGKIIPLHQYLHPHPFQGDDDNDNSHWYWQHHFRISRPRKWQPQVNIIHQDFEDIELFQINPGCYDIEPSQMKTDCYDARISPLKVVVTDTL